MNLSIDVGNIHVLYTLIRDSEEKPHNVYSTTNVDVL